MAAYLAELAMFLTTKAVVGRLGYEELAAVGLAGDIMFEVLVILMGLLSVVGVFIAQAEGAGEQHKAGHATRQGLIVAIVLSLPASLFVWYASPLLLLMGQEATVVDLATPFLRALMLSVLPVLWFSVLRSFVAALSRTTVIMVITITTVGLNYLLAIGLVHGRFGLPAMGVQGAGWALTIASWFMFIVLFAYIYFKPDLRGYGLFRNRLRIDKALCFDIVKLGLPVAGIVFLEAGLFMTISILSGVLGTEILAAHQVLMGWVAMAFVIGLGLAEATMIRVALGMGRKSLATARQAGVVGITLGISILALLVVVPLGFAETIVSVFLQKDDASFTTISILVTRLLLIVAVFQVFDGLQAIASRALRAMKDTVVPLWLAGFGYWVLGIGGGCLLAFPLQLGVTGLWLGLAAGLIVTASLLTWRFLKLTSCERA